jgi:hypothetical protein
MDYWASYIAYFFDIAYPETMDIIEENQYVERIIRRIPYSNSDTEHKMWKLYELVRDYFTMAKSS